MPERGTLGPEQRTEALAEANQWLLLGRLLIAIIAISMVILSGGGLGRAQSGHWAYWAYTGALAYLFLDLLYLLATSRLRRAGNMETFIVLQSCGDLAIATTLLYFTGGIFSPFFFLMFAVLLTVAAVLQPRTAAVFFLVVAVVTGIVTVVQGAGMVPQGSPFYRPYRTTELLASYIGRMAALGAVGWLALILSRRLAVARILSAEILESTGEGILVLDGEGRAVYESEQFRSLIGSSHMGENFQQFPPFSLLPELREYVRRPAARPIRMPLPHAGYGEERPFLIDAHELDGDIRRGVLVRFQDLSISEKLEYAERRAERYQAVADAARNIAHEIRNPLSSLNVALQELVRGLDLPPDRKDLVSVIRSEVRRLDRILEVFLDYSRPRKPSLRLAALRGIADESAGIISHHEPGRPVNVEVQGPPELTARVDPDLLRQALLNLGINAVQAGACNISIRLEPGVERAGRDFILIEVGDDGSGMDPRQREKAFEPFFTTRTTGTGLGLSMVRKVLEEHNGVVEVESEPGKGSIFRLYLPVAEDDPATERTDG